MQRRDAEELRLSVAGLSIAARAWGPRDGRPVLALHGWLDNAASFDRLAPLLSPGVRLVAMDFSGHGRSDHRGTGAGYAFVEWVPEVLGVADALGWQRFSLVGHSMGAGVSTLVAATATDRVQRAVLIEGLGPLTAPAEQAPEQLARALAAQRLASKPRDYPDLETAVEVRRVQPRAELSDVGARLLVERQMRPVAGGLRWRFDPRLRWPSLVRLTEPQAIAFVKRVICPVLLVLASDGWPGLSDLVNQRRGRLRDCTVVQLPGGHHLHLDRPELVRQPIDDFLLLSER